MPWQLLRTQTPPPVPSEGWFYIPMDAPVGVLAYAFRVPAGADVPENWSTAGYWCLLQVVSGVLVVSASHPIQLAGRGANAPLRYVGPQEVDLITEQASVLALGMSLHKWLPRSPVELWGLYP